VLKEVFSEDEMGQVPALLDSRRLRTLLCLVMRNYSTGSPWPISNNPAAKFNDPASPECNLRIPLWQLVRASTAAPTFFPPETIELGGRRHVFVDGGITPYNNPSLLLYLMATLPCFRLEWERGLDKLLLRPLEIVVRLPQGVIRTPQLADRPAGEHHADQLAGSRQTRRAVQRNRQRAPITTRDQQLAILHRRRTRREKLARTLARGVIGKKLAHRLAAQRILVQADNPAQRIIHLLDQAVAIAHDQNVGNRSKNAFDELLRVFQRRILLFERHFVLQEVVVDLVHLVNDLDPDAFVNPVQGRRTGLRRGWRSQPIRR